MSELEVSPKVHHSDEVNLRSATVIRDYLDGSYQGMGIYVYVRQCVHGSCTWVDTEWTIEELSVSSFRRGCHTVLLIDLPLARELHRSFAHGAASKK